MIRGTTSSRECQQERLQHKTQDQQLINKVVEGTSVSPWEAKILVDVVKEVYFSEFLNRPLQSGQMRYACVASTEGAGKPIRHCQMVSVILSVLDKEGSEVNKQLGQQALRQNRIMRLTEEAREQGGLLSQEDLASLLFSDVRTIRRDIQELRIKHGIFVSTRGQLKDIGPGVSHKEVALKLWLEGKEPVEVARRINHTLHAVERYIQHFSRVVFLQMKRFGLLQIALTVGLSSAAVRTYLELYETCRKKRAYQRRLREMEVIGANHYQAEDAKKGGLFPSGNTKKGGKRP